MMDTKIVFAEISSAATIITNDLLKLVSNERQEKIKKFRFDIDRKLSLYSELIVRHQVHKYLNISNNDIVFRRNSNGKPFFLNQPEFQFNISHTRNAIAVAFSNNNIGVDIESIKPVDLAIADRFFTFPEKDYISSHNHLDYAFFEVWTKKEAYIKYIGSGLSIPLKSFNVLDAIHAKKIFTYKVKKYIFSVYIDEATKKRPALIKMTENELESIFNRN